MRNSILLLLVLALFGSCSKWVAPTYTSVDKILQVEKEMSQVEVNEVLDVWPYNLLHLNDSTSLFEYRYRVKNRRLNGSSGSKNNHSEASQIGGEDWYDQPSSLYILFKDNKVSGLITENGLENSEDLLMSSNNLMLISKDEWTDFREADEEDIIQPIETEIIHEGDTIQEAPLIRHKKHAVLYSASVPWSFIGIKYAYLGKFGAYASAASDLGLGDDVIYLAAGPTIRISPAVSLYLGGGYELEYQESYAEAGIVLKMNNAAIELGGGYNINNVSFSYGKVGFGIRF